jgi:hypothetical protein
MTITVNNKCFTTEFGIMCNLSLTVMWLGFFSLSHMIPVTNAYIFQTLLDVCQDNESVIHDSPHCNNQNLMYSGKKSVETWQNPATYDIVLDFSSMLFIDTVGVSAIQQVDSISMFTERISFVFLFLSGSCKLELF